MGCASKTFHTLQSEVSSTNEAITSVFKNFDSPHLNLSIARGLAKHFGKILENFVDVLTAATKLSCKIVEKVDAPMRHSPFWSSTYNLFLANFSDYTVTLASQARLIVEKFDEAYSKLDDELSATATVPKTEEEEQAAAEAHIDQLIDFVVHAFGVRKDLFSKTIPESPPK